MAARLLLALACAAAAAGARYSDYSGVKLPHYGAPDYDNQAASAAAAEDYRDRAPDSSAHLDYKYEEEASDKIKKAVTKDVEEVEQWQEPIRKQRKHRGPIDDGDSEPLDKYNLDEDAPKFKTGHRSIKNRPRVRNKALIRNDELSNRRLVKYRRTKDDDVDPKDVDADNNIQPHQDVAFVDKSSEFEDDKSQYVRREIKRKVRRKPRDRPVIKTIRDDLDDDIEREVKEPRPALIEDDTEYELGTARRRPTNVERGNRPKGRTRESGDHEVVPRPPAKSSKIYDDYSDYYDMKRVQRIKNKLPTLLRRTKARALETTASESILNSWSTRRALPGRKSAMIPVRVSKMRWSGRRAFMGPELDYENTKGSTPEWAMRRTLKEMDRKTMQDKSKNIKPPLGELAVEEDIDYEGFNTSLNGEILASERFPGLDSEIEGPRSMKPDKWLTATDIPDRESDIEVSRKIKPDKSRTVADITELDSDMEKGRRIKPDKWSSVADIPDLDSDDDLLKKISTAGRVLSEQAPVTLKSIESSTTTITTKPTSTPENESMKMTQPITQLISSTLNTSTSVELSIAEKSMLSILKKSQRKESIFNMTTKKPPVLLQVTQKIYTVVIVEPPVQQDPWLRAREVSDDTPSRLEKVKRLMRRKLVSGAKNIRELTDNWDDMICDYIDVSLLDDKAYSNHCNGFLFSISIILFIAQ